MSQVDREQVNPNLTFNNKRNLVEVLQNPSDKELSVLRALASRVHTKVKEFLDSKLPDSTFLGSMSPEQIKGSGSGSYVLVSPKYGKLNAQVLDGQLYVEGELEPGNSIFLGGLIVPCASVPVYALRK
jgi:hypothetical protein